MTYHKIKAYCISNGMKPGKAEYVRKMIAKLVAEHEHCAEDISTARHMARMQSAIPCDSFPPIIHHNGTDVRTERYALGRTWLNPVVTPAPPLRGQRLRYIQTPDDVIGEQAPDMTTEKLSKMAEAFDALGRIGDTYPHDREMWTDLTGEIPE